jgi:hypothetical protein
VYKVHTVHNVCWIWCCTCISSKQISTKNAAFCDQLTRIYWKWFPSKYYLTLKIIFGHYNWDFENFFQGLCFFITKYALEDFSFYRPIRFDSKPRAFNPAQKSMGTPKFYRVQYVQSMSTQESNNKPFSWFKGLSKSR